MINERVVDLCFFCSSLSWVYANAGLLASLLISDILTVSRARLRWSVPYPRSISTFICMILPHTKNSFHHMRSLAGVTLFKVIVKGRKSRKLNVYNVFLADRLCGVTWHFSPCLRKENNQSSSYKCFSDCNTFRDIAWCRDSGAKKCSRWRYSSQEQCAAEDISSFITYSYYS